MMANVCIAWIVSLDMRNRNLALQKPSTLQCLVDEANSDFRVPNSVLEIFGSNHLGEV